MAETQALPLPVGAAKPPMRRSGWAKAYFGTPLNSMIKSCLDGGDLLTGQAGVWLAGGQCRLCRRCRRPARPAVARAGRFSPRNSAATIFGFYPFEEQWRPLLALTLFLASCLISMMPRFWSRALLYAWLLLFLPVLYVLMAGGVFGLSPVPTSSWGGLPLSFMLSFIGLVCALPLGIGLCACARLQPAGNPRSCGWLYRDRPRRSPDQHPVHGNGDAALVHAGGRDHRQAFAGAGRHHHLRCRLYRRNCSRRPAGCSGRPVRGGIIPWPVLLAGNAKDRPAAGVEKGHSPDGRAVYRLFPGYDAGHHCRPARFSRHRALGAQGSRMAGHCRPRRLCISPPPSISPSAP